MIVIKTTTIIMNLRIDIYLNSIWSWYSSINNIWCLFFIPEVYPISKSLPRNSHRKKNVSFNTYPLAMQPIRCAFCQTYLFRVFIYRSKKNIHLVDTTPANSMSSTRCISKQTCRPMKLVGISFSNTRTISAISFFHFGTSHSWISLEVTHII